MMAGAFSSTPHANILDDADDLLPGHAGELPYPLADGGSSRAHDSRAKFSETITLVLRP